MAISPNDPEAIELRAGLFVLTGRLVETKEAYATLEKMDGAYAATLKRDSGSPEVRQVFPGQCLAEGPGRLQKMGGRPRSGYKPIARKRGKRAKRRPFP